MFGNPYYHNPFLTNPLLMMMMGLQNQPMNPYEGNGLLHPVYISPHMMHQLEQSVPEWKDPSLDNAKAGNMDCMKGATVSCTDSGTETRVVENDVNPCDNNLYSSFIRSDKACDEGYAYYTCETFEELDVFANACSRHEQGAKVDVPKVTVYGHSKYTKWRKKVMKNRMDGKGRDIMMNDGYIDPGLGSSRGEGQSHGAPVSDKELGNVPDDKYHKDKGYRANVQMQNNILYEPYEQEKSQIEEETQSMEIMLVSFTGILFSAFSICFCCILALLCGFIIKKTMKRIMKNKQSVKKSYEDMTAGHFTTSESSSEDEEDQNEDDDPLPL